MRINNQHFGLTIAAMAVMSVAGLSAPDAHAASVRASLSSSEAYVGMPVTLRIEISNAAQHQAPTVPSIDGVDVRSSGAASRSSQTTIINGRRSERSSVTYAWQLTPRRAGTFVIPPIEVSVNGRREMTRTMRFSAEKSETGDLMFVEVDGQAKKIYVGQPLDLTLRIWIKPYHDQQYDITLSEGDMWQLIAGEQSNWGTFSERMTELSQNRERIRGREVSRADGNGKLQTYYRYDIDATIYPKRPGNVDAGDVQIVANYPTGLARSRSFFSMGDLAISGVRPIVADASVAPIDVTAIPNKGRPADYRGAVGEYQIVTQASPTRTKAGDPITLHIGIRGDGPMELVQAPPLSELPELINDFQVPEEALAGHVKGD
ncbi:MAG: BatD family protein, partial [Pirellulales bacterium]|nr:BatD family protein [Pirellulales bacterium]